MAANVNSGLLGKLCSLRSFRCTFFFCTSWTIGFILVGYLCHASVMHSLTGTGFSHFPAVFVEVFYNSKLSVDPSDSPTPSKHQTTVL